MAAEPAVVSLLLLGDSQIGKSTLLSRLSCKQGLPANCLPVLRDFSQPFVFEVTTRKDVRYRLEFYDTASPTHFSLLRPDVIILCFSIADRASLENVLSKWKHLVETHFNYDERMPVMLLALKRDLRREGDPRVVFPQEGVRIASEMRCDMYAECSAVTTELCKEVFEDIVKMAVGTTTEGGGKSPDPSCVVM